MKRLPQYVRAKILANRPPWRNLARRKFVVGRELPFARRVFPGCTEPPRAGYLAGRWSWRTFKRGNKHHNRPRKARDVAL